MGARCQHTQRSSGGSGEQRSSQGFRCWAAVTRGGGLQSARQGKRHEVRQGAAWREGIPCRQRGAAAGVTRCGRARRAEAAATCRGSEDGGQRAREQWRGRGRAWAWTGVGAGQFQRAGRRAEAGDGKRAERRAARERGRGGGRGARKQRQLTISSDATGAGSALYCRARSGTRCCDIVVIAVVVVEGAGQQGPGAGGEGGSSCSSAACAISRPQTGR